MGRLEFELRTVNSQPYFTLPALENMGIVNGFMTKASDCLISDKEEGNLFFRSLGATGRIIMEQEHGSTVHIVERGERPRVGDGLFMVEKGVAGIIKTADCLPVILYAMDERVAAIVHAGWRGTVKGITEKALRLMIARGLEKDRIGALIGPGIGPCCYEVGQDVVSEFRKARFSQGVFLTRGDSIFLDLKKANRELIERTGIREIHDIGLCTSCSPELFHSARRDKQIGRQISFVLVS